MKTSEVFGVNTAVSDYSYVDRGNLDGQIAVLSGRNNHIALRGESKSGKSWLRQKSFPEAVVIQCRLDYSAEQIFVAVLAALEVKLVKSETITRGAALEFSGEGEAGWKLLAKAKAALKLSGNIQTEAERQPVGRDITDLSFICELINQSGRKVVIEDFHYLKTEVQRQFAHDLKAMWDYSTYVVIIGVWVRRNYLTHLNPDLAGRIAEVSIYWQDDELRAVLEKGSLALNIVFSDQVKRRIVEDCFGNVGLLQSLALGTLDQCGISARMDLRQTCGNIDAYETAALLYAEQLEAVYLEFARRVSNGIRQRKGSTKIYAHAMLATFESSAAELIDGVNVDTIYNRARLRQPRVQKGNLKSILRKIDGLQIDDRGKGLVVTFVEQSDAVAVVDRSVLFYQKYRTVSWPWQSILEEGEGEELEAD